MTSTPRSDGARQAVMGGQARAGTTALTVTLGLAAGSWAGAVSLMRGMDSGPATRLGSFAWFIAAWVLMMAAMMLPGAAPAVAGRARSAGVRAAGLFAGGYLAVWAVAGAGIYAAYRPHGTAAAAVVTIAAGVYELTPVKRRFRHRCHDGTASALGFGLCCVGSSAGLMAMLVALGVMSIGWMAVITIVVLVQKLVPATTAIDVPLALAIIGLGTWILLAPASVPWLAPPM